MINHTTETYRNKGIILGVFLLTLCIRAYWIHEKENLYNDELTSICLAYDSFGWGEKTFEPERIYTGEELRNIFYLDDRKGLEGLKSDLQALHKDNRDPSHASLYYMALRIALTGMSSPTMEQLIRCSCMLNMAFFILSFFCLYRLLKEISPDISHWTAGFILLCAYVSPAVISNVLLAREYQLAEWLFILWTLWCVRTAKRIKENKTLYSANCLLKGILISAALLSCGYFNALYLGLTGLSLFAITYKQHHSRNFGFYLLLATGCIIVCKAIYDGFFNFIHDVRTAEVTGKIQGENWASNLFNTVYLGCYIFGIRILTPVWAVALMGAFSYQLSQKRWKPKYKLPEYSWIFICAWIWMFVIFLLSPWKSTRYISAVIPLLLITTTHAYQALMPKRLYRPITLCLTLAFIAYGFTEHPIEHLERTDSRPWNPDAKRIILYAPNNEEKNTLQLLIPHLDNKQECVIMETAHDLYYVASPKDKYIYVYGERDIKELRSHSNFIKEERFNEFMDVYTFSYVQPAP